MTLTLDLQPEIEQGILARAAAHGQSLDEYVKDILVRQAHVFPEPVRIGSDARDLVELFASSPFAGLDMDFERDKGTGREIDL